MGCSARGRGLGAAPRPVPREAPPLGAQRPLPPRRRPREAVDELRPGARVRHPLFGVGTVLRREGDGDDLKLTVSFPGVGAKKLVARFAGLELV